MGCRSGCDPHIQCVWCDALVPTVAAAVPLPSATGLAVLCRCSALSCTSHAGSRIAGGRGRCCRASGADQSRASGWRFGVPV